MSEIKQKYPPKTAATCVVCEDVRAEVSGKLVLIGVYPGETIKFFKQPTNESPGHVNLAFSFWFRRGAGKFNTRFSVIGPDGNCIVERELGEQTVDPDSVMTFAVKVQNAEFIMVGSHTIVASLDDKNYEFPLFITYSEGTQSLPSVAEKHI